MSYRGTQRLAEAIQKVVDYHVEEYRMTGCEIVGALEVEKFRVLHECQVYEEEKQQRKVSRE